MPDSKLLFVVHKHHSTRLHYDLRLQVGNVFPSWAITKGPTLDNTKKRLAIKVKDRNLEYSNFEGVIGKGLYGAGPIMIWDEGYFNPEIETEPGVRIEISDYEKGQQVLKKGKRKGELKFFLYGQKLKGSFALIKTPNFGPKNSWLLIKHKDHYVQKEYDANNFDNSAISGKSLKEIQVLK